MAVATNIKYVCSAVNSGQCITHSLHDTIRTHTLCVLYSVCILYSAHSTYSTYSTHSTYSMSFYNNQFFCLFLWFAHNHCQTCLMSLATSIECHIGFDTLVQAFVQEFKWNHTTLCLKCDIFYYFNFDFRYVTLDIYNIICVSPRNHNNEFIL